MFDHLRSEFPLPDSDLPPGYLFQTKDLECDLAHYLIDAGGRLLLCRTIADEALESSGAVDTEHHGDVRFYGHSASGEWREFVARFTDGTLVWVKRDHDHEAERSRQDHQPLAVSTDDGGRRAEGIQARQVLGIEELCAADIEALAQTRAPAFTRAFDHECGNPGDGASLALPAEPYDPCSAEAADLRETLAEAERRIAQARHLKALARDGGLRFSGYLPPDLAEWMLEQIEQGVFLDPSEAVFGILKEHHDLTQHKDLRRELLRRSVQSAMDDPRPGIPAEQVFAELEERLSRHLPEPAEWRKAEGGGHTSD